MSKKINQPTDAKKIDEQKLATVFGLDNKERDEDGFVKLKPSDTTKKVFEQIRAKRTSKFGTVPVKESSPAPEYDPDILSDLLDIAEEKVKDGKYGKALDNLNDITKKVLTDFCDIFTDIDPTDPKFKEMSGFAKKLMSIGKSFYEYDDKNRVFIPDNFYDGIRNKYQQLGLVEPAGIVPAGKKNLKKVDIKWPTLANNVDKAYIIRKDDKAPKGVKESDSVEAFLMRVYKTLNLEKSEEIEIEISPKIDGVSINGTINDQYLENPQTRGDENASVSVMGLNHLEIRDEDFKNSEDFGIQYEVFVTEKNRLKASEYLKMDEPYVSCRHAAAGIIHRLCTAEDDKLIQYLSFYPIATEGFDGTYLERMDYIQAYGDVPSDMIERKLVKGDFNELIKDITNIFGEVEKSRSKLSFAIDGIVITVANDEYQRSLGRSGRTNKFQIALKFDPSSASAVVDHIELECGDKGYRTIQVYFTDVAIIDGVRYDHVPVLSARLFDDLELYENSKVTVHRVGDVIPSITKESDGNGVKIKLPKRCPVCGEPLIIDSKKLYCENLHCEANVKGRFMSFFKELELDDYSDAFAQALVDGGVRSIEGLVDLTVNDLNNMGITGKRAAAFPDAVKTALGKMPDYVVLASLGFPKIGRERAKLILKAVPFNKLDEPIDECELVSTCMPKFNPMFIINILNDNHNVFKKLKPYVKNITKDFDSMVNVGHTGGKISKECADLIRSMGYSIVDGKNFDILIVPSYDHKSKKMEIAKENDEIFIYTEEDFINRYGKKSSTTTSSGTAHPNETLGMKLDNLRFGLKTKIW